MAEDIQGLITKIQQEGIKIAEEKAKDIENEARRRAKEIVLEAEKQAQGLLVQAKDEVAKAEKGAKASLEQAARDLLLTLREEINAMLGRLILAQVRQALKPEELSKIITALIKEISSKDEGEIIVSLKEKDLEKLGKGLLSTLGNEAKKEITLKSSGEISGGFTISYDSGKSHYDFTDKAIAEYLSLNLKPKLAEALKKASSGDRSGTRQKSN